MVMSDLSPEVEIRPFRACAMHPAIIIGTVRSLWMWLLGRYHVPQNSFLVLYIICIASSKLMISLEYAIGYLCKICRQEKHMYHIAFVGLVVVVVSLSTAAIHAAYGWRCMRSLSMHTSGKLTVSTCCNIVEHSEVQHLLTQCLYVSLSVCLSITVVSNA